MTLKSSEILQIDATVIAGVLILLTISAGQYQNPIWQLGKGFALLNWLIIFPFAMSAIFALKMEIKNLEGKSVDDIDKKGIRNSLILMTGGFAYMLIFLGIYVIKLAYFS